MAFLRFGSALPFFGVGSPSKDDPDIFVNKGDNPFQKVGGGGDRLQTLIHAMNHLTYSSINSYAIFLLLMPKFIYRSIERLKRYCAG